MGHGRVAIGPTTSNEEMQELDNNRDGMIDPFERDLARLNINSDLLNLKRSRLTHWSWRYRYLVGLTEKRTRRDG